MTEAQNGPEVALQGEEAPRGGIGTCDTHSHTRERDRGPQERDSGTRRGASTPALGNGASGSLPVVFTQHGNVGWERKALGPPESLRDMGCWVA